MTLVIDPRGAGISGDMMLSALVDMGADGGAISDGLAECDRYLDGSTISHMSFKTVYRGGTRCTALVLESCDPAERPASDMVRAIDLAASHMKLGQKAYGFAGRSIGALVAAESRIHGGADGMLHESASIDTLVDIVGTACALEWAGALDGRTVTMPVNVGSGTVTFSHGTYPNPAPAVLEILREARIAMAGSSIRAETATPTGACILAGLGAVSQSHYPCVAAQRTGYGAGSRDYEGTANMLVLAQGTAGGNTETVCVLETSIDDVTGEFLGGAITRIIKEGALDAAAYPGVGKKGRVTHLLYVICMPHMADHITHTIIRQTGTLGVRVRYTERVVLPREGRSITVGVDGSEYTFHYKVHTHLEETDFKIEYDDIARASSASGMSTRRVERLVRRHIEDAQ